MANAASKIKLHVFSSLVYCASLCGNISSTCPTASVRAVPPQSKNTSQLSRQASTRVMNKAGVGDCVGGGFVVGDALEGDFVGALIGDFVGALVEDFVGGSSLVGSCVGGASVGDAVGNSVGVNVGTCVGANVGMYVGDPVGRSVGHLEGLSLGNFVGYLVGV